MVTGAIIAILVAHLLVSMIGVMVLAHIADIATRLDRHLSRKQ
jgi:hypothetical protein